MGQYRSKRRGWCGPHRVVVVIAWMLTAPAVWAAEDPYLTGLQDEAQKLDSLGQAKKEQQMLERQAPPKAAAVKPSSVNAPQAAFESELEQYPAGFGLYEKLNAKDRDVVFQEYLKAPPNRRYAAAIRKTIELSIRK